jgi:hypothetical protein
MSRFDRVDVSVLGKCCIGAIQVRVQLAAAGDLLACLCGAKLEHRDGRWRLAADQFRATLSEPGTVAM